MQHNCSKQTSHHVNRFRFKTLYLLLDF
uniref:Uncharacterized protein n=1 Tax=Anguilla anguilla TaxID=7936 RepID=A0A0E9VLI5_ANGAN